LSCQQNKETVLPGCWRKMPECWKSRTLSTNKHHNLNRVKMCLSHNSVIYI
jgi:hypothetical protein